MIVLVDIDGSLSDDRWRRDLAEAKRWDEYHDVLGEDPPVKHLVTLINALAECGHPIFAVTGRPERYRTATLAWMIRHNVKIDELWMRPDEDHSPAPQLKIKLAKELLDVMTPVAGEEIVIIIDDREDILAAMRGIGIYTLGVSLL